MICPNCKCEYVRGVTQCPECDVALVDSLNLHRTSGEESRYPDVRLVSIWRGNDPAEGERIKEALEKADIPFTVPDSKRRPLQRFLHTVINIGNKFAYLQMRIGRGPERFFSIWMGAQIGTNYPLRRSSRWHFRNRTYWTAKIKRSSPPDFRRMIGTRMIRLPKFGMVTRRASGYVDDLPSGNWNRIA